MWKIQGTIARIGLRLSLRLGPTLGLSVALTVLIVAGCAGGAPSVSPTSGGAEVQPTDTPPIGSSLPPIPVLGTENFYGDLLAQIGGPRVKVTSLLDDPSADPHAFEASPLAAAATADARLVVVNGLGYDAFMDKLLAAAPRPDRTVIDVQRLLGLGEGVNVHVWYDPATMPMVARAVTDELVAIEPASAPAFHAGEQAYLASLGRISERLAALRAKYLGTPIAFTENVAGYLTDAVGLDLRTPPGFMKAIEDGTDPAPGDVAAERDLLTSRAVKVLVYNDQVTSPATQQIHDLAASIGIPIVGVAETMPPRYHTFADWQLAQLDDLERALSQATQP